MFVFTNFTAYPLKKALGIIFQVLTTLLNLQSVTELSRKSKEGKQIVFSINKCFGFFKVITF